MVKRYSRILGILFEIALVYKSRSFVWFLISLINPLILLMYWIGYAKSSTTEVINISSISSYYFLLIIAGALLMSHVEEEIAYEDIQLGNLSRYLLLPISYLSLNFFGEIPWRVIQGFFGVVIFSTSVIVFGELLHYTVSVSIILQSIIICCIAYILSFIYKVTAGLIAFWFTEFSGFNELLGILTLLLAGYIMPLDYYPSGIKELALNLPFAYMIYYPIKVLQGNVPWSEFWQIILVQIIYIGLFYSLYKIMWREGVKKFTGVGN